MTEKELPEMRPGLLMLSPHIAGEVPVVVDKCRFMDLPSPKVVQGMVTLWKVLWRWRK